MGGYMRNSITELSVADVDTVCGGQSQDGICQAPCYTTKTDPVNAVFAAAMVIVTELAIIAVGYFSGKYFQKVKTN